MVVRNRNVPHTMVHHHLVSADAPRPRELRPGLVVWVSRLNKFIRLYGLRYLGASYTSHTPT